MLSEQNKSIWNWIKQEDHQEIGRDLIETSNFLRAGFNFKMKISMSERNLKNSV